MVIFVDIEMGSDIESRGDSSVEIPAERSIMMRGYLGL